jgi:hypothetical protein
MSEQEKERIRMAIEDIIGRAWESGWTRKEIEDEVAYCLDSFDEDDSA